MLVAVLLALTSAFAHPLRQHRLSLADWDSYSFRDHKGPGTYAFGYDIEDADSNNVQFRQEERHANGSVTGSYGYVQPTGQVRIVHYIADTQGYRVREEAAPTAHPHPLPAPVHPAHFEDTPIFEGEFFPAVSEEETETNNLDNNKPILFPPTPSPPAGQLFPPFHDHISNDFSNDVNFDFNPHLQRISRPKQISPQVNVGFLQAPGYGQKQVLLYQNPYGANGGFVRFRVHA